MDMLLGDVKGTFPHYMGAGNGGGGEG